MHTHTPARRNFLKLSARLAALGLTGMGAYRGRSFFVEDVIAAPAITDYKALVCVYLFGGNDGNNVIVPVDTARYTAYQTLRAGLALTPARLLAPIADGAGNQYALNSNLAELQTGFTMGKVAIVLNTGQLERPLTRAQYQSGVLAPANLFSHSDQQLQAQTATSQNVVSGGWGGRLLDAFGVSDTLAAVSVSSPAMFLQSGGGAPNVIPPGASLGLSGMNISPTSAATARKQAVAAMLALDGGHPLRAAANDAFADGLQLAETLSGSGSVTINTVFPGTGLGTQLREVARLIKMRATIGPGRQVFFCSMSGFDTHTSQDGTHSNLLRELSAALGAFYTATEEIGLPNNVTAFTQSEFARTFQPNGTGTDHAWGSHQFIVGGAVRGGIYGALPTLALGGPDDSGNRGAWIPTIGTSQFGATLGKWFGAAPADLTATFPNLVNFATSDVGFML